MEGRFSLGEKLFVYIYSLALLLGIIMLSITTAAPVSRIFVSFSPSILVIITVIILFEQSRYQFRIVSWILPIFWPVVLYMLAGAGLMQKTETGSILAFNFLISFIFVLVLELMVSAREGVVNIFKKVKVEIPENPKPSDVEKAMQSIEDKAKAINQVVGRVYRRSNGATLAMRNKLKIEPSLYNKFSQHTAQKISENPQAALDLLWKISNKLNILYMTEEDVFSDDSYKLRNLAREPTGKTRIIDVLIANDSDPVSIYFKSALEFCKKAIEEIEIIKK